MVTLPPIDTHNTSLVAVSAPITSHTSQGAKLTSTEKKNETALSHILEAARLAKLRQHQGEKVTNSNGSRPPQSKTSPKQVLNRVVSFTTPRSSDNKTKYVVPESASCPTTFSDFEGSEIAESSSQLHNSKSTSSMDSVFSSKPQLNNEDSSKTTVNRQTCAKVNSQTDIVQLLEPAGGTRDPMSRNIITMEQLMALTQTMRFRGKHGSVHSTPLHKGNTHHVQTKPNLGPRKTGVYAKTAMHQHPKLGQLTASKLPHIPSQSISSTVTKPKIQPVKVSLPALQRGRRQTRPRRNTTNQKYQGQRKKELVVAKGMQLQCIHM